MVQDLPGEVPERVGAVAEAVVAVGWVVADLGWGENVSARIAVTE
jgi:hypothetical protein